MKKQIGDSETMERKINVLHLINELEYGGAEVLLLDFARHFNREKLNLFVAFLDGEGTLRGAIESQGVRVFDLSLKGRKNPLVFFSILRLIKKLDIDVVNTHLVMASVIGSAAAKASKVKVLVTTRHYDYNKEIKSLRFKLDRLMAKYPDCLVVVSRETKRIVKQEEKLKVKQIQVIYNGTDVDYFNPLKKSQSKLDTSPKIIGSIGRLTTQKGYDKFIKIISKLVHNGARINAEIIGVGEDYQRLVEQSKAMGVSENVHFCGRLSRERVKEKLSLWDIFMLTSNWEAFGIVTTEAMAMELPVVVSKVGGLTEIVRDGIDGFLVESGDIDGFAEKVSYLLENPESAMEMGRNARQRVIENFSIQKMVNSYQRLYIKLLESKGYQEFVH